MLCQIDELTNSAVAGWVRFVPLDEDDIPHPLSPRQVICQ
jgi:hypothetical protein